MNRTGVAYAHELRGCSASEISTLQALYGVVPPVYREYLERMGHSSGRLFTHDHVAVTLEYVLEMTNELRLELATDAPDLPPPGSLVIAGRLGEQFEFIELAVTTGDAPVYYFNTYDLKVRQSHPSVLAWLECWCTAAEDAIGRGYFHKYPQGTTP